MKNSRRVQNGFSFAISSRLLPFTYVEDDSWRINYVHAIFHHFFSPYGGNGVLNLEHFQTLPISAIIHGYDHIANLQSKIEYRGGHYSNLCLVELSENSLFSNKSCNSWEKFSHPLNCPSSSLPFNNKSGGALYKEKKRKKRNTCKHVLEIHKVIQMAKFPKSELLIQKNVRNFLEFPQTRDLKRIFQWLGLVTLATRSYIRIPVLTEKDHSCI